MRFFSWRYWLSKRSFNIENVGRCRSPVFRLELGELAVLGLHLRRHLVLQHLDLVVPYVQEQALPSVASLQRKSPTALGVRDRVFFQAVCAA